MTFDVAVGILGIQLMGVYNAGAVDLGLVRYMYIVCHHYHVKFAYSINPKQIKLPIALLNIHGANSSVS